MFPVHTVEPPGVTKAYCSFIAYFRPVFCFIAAITAGFSAR